MRKFFNVVFILAAFSVSSNAQTNLTKYGTTGNYGNYSSYFGYYAGKNATNSAERNVFMGYYAGERITSGDNNCTFGAYAGRYLTTGSNNVYMGRMAGYNNATGSGNLFLGYYAGYNETGSNKLYIDNSSTSSPLIYGDFSTDFVAINGNLGIGTTNTKGYKLGVNGSIAATEVVVAQYANWPDYVFSEDYNLPELSEVEEYIKENNHLPNVPSASDIEETGVPLGEMNRILLQKVEELTLYMIELKNENKDIKDQLTKLKGN